MEKNPDYLNMGTLGHFYHLHVNFLAQGSAQGTE
jgi:hypothetical protein